ncbi:MAG: alpha/beta hydrolase [Acidimicrobiales bacterium]
MVRADVGRPGDRCGRLRPAGIRAHAVRARAPRRARRPHRRPRFRDRCTGHGRRQQPRGGLALDLALARPDLVERLVLVAASPTGYPYDDWPTAPSEAELDARIEAAEAAGDLDLVNRLEVRYWLDGVDEPEGRVTGARSLMLEMNGLALHATAGPDARTGPSWTRLSEVSCATFVLVGELDLPGTRLQAEQLAGRLPNSRFATIADSAHCPQLDQPEVLAELVRRFVEE